MGALTSKPYMFISRSWELESIESIDFFDSFGSNIKVDIRGKEILRVLPKILESLNEEWISDKIRFSYDSLKKQRLDVPLIKFLFKKNFYFESKKFFPSTWEKFFMIIKDFFKLFSFSFVIGNFVDFYTLYTLKKFIIKKNPFLLKLPVFVEKNFFNDFRFNFLSPDFKNFLSCDLFIFICVNLRLESPILNLRIRKNILQKKIKSFGVGCGFGFNFDFINLGFSLKNLLFFFEGKHKLSFNFLKSKKPLIVIGSNFLKRKDFFFFNKFFLFFFKKFNYLMISYLSLRVSDSSVFELNLNNNKIFDNFLKIDNQKNFLWVLDFDDFSFCSNFYKFSLYQGHHGDKIALKSNFILPACAPLEKNAIFINFEGRYQKSKLCSVPPLNSREDWKVLSILSIYLDLDLGFYDLFLLHKDIENYLGGFFLNIVFDKFKFFLNFTYFYKFNNFVFFPINYNYYLSDSFSKFSVVMALASKRFFNLSFNFKKKN